MGRSGREEGPVVKLTDVETMFSPMGRRGFWVVMSPRTEAGPPVGLEGFTTGVKWATAIP
jgi:hypothetical protein